MRRLVMSLHFQCKKLGSEPKCETMYYLRYNKTGCYYCVDLPLSIRGVSLNMATKLTKKEARRLQSKFKSDGISVKIVAC